MSETVTVTLTFYDFTNLQGSNNQTKCVVLCIRDNDKMTMTMNVNDVVAKPPDFGRFQTTDFRFQIPDTRWVPNIAEC